ncbi:unnamed protein product [Hermetia illucens]|uniref:Cytochrome P450 n=1 Tax=Hermetia illucens TaxID=343691 RepID=A0A7R8UH52_HERIL|nr:methyl farnesoate epoxidase-like [Hermetia illucens]CAD7080762.1 unnamed protein product [Hermetia illucens]
MIGVLFVITILILFIWKDTEKPQGFPPGPKWLPIVGSIPLIQQLHQFYKFYHLVWQHFTSYYGPVVGFRIGRDKLVVVSGREAIKELYSREEFNGRPKGFFFRVRTFGKREGVVFTDGHDWETLKRFSLKAMKQLGNGRSGMIAHIEKEAAEMVEYFRSKADTELPVDMGHAFDVPVLNVMWALLAGYRFHTDDDRLLMLLSKIHDSFRVIDMSGGILNQFPFIRHIFPEKSGYRKLVQTHLPIWNFLVETVVEIRDKMVPNTPPKSIIEAFLIEIESKNANSSVYNSEQLLAICLDFFQAGSETTSNTLGFGIIYMLHYPEILRKVREEIDMVVSRSRTPCLADRPNLPYTEAVIYEIQRFANVAPLAIAHRALSTTKFYDYVIPEDTIVIVSTYSLNMDKSYWKDPHNFRPERFLDEEGRLVHYDAFIPFGLGKRRCMGENLARSSLFLFFSSFVQNFDVILFEGQPLPDIEGLDGITLSPKPYKAVLKIRN